MRRLLVCLVMVMLVGGCATKRRIPIGTEPPDAIIFINGRDMGRGPLNHTFEFSGAKDKHRVWASGEGYATSKIYVITPDSNDKQILIPLKPNHAEVIIKVVPH